MNKLWVIRTCLLCPQAWLLGGGVGLSVWWVSIGRPGALIAALGTGIVTTLALMGESVLRKRLKQESKALATRKRSEAIMTDVLRRAHAVIWMSEPSGDRTFVSDRWATLTSGTVETSLAAGWRVRAHPDDLERIDGARSLALANGEPYDIDYRLQSPDGEWRWVREHVTTCVVDDEVTAFVGVTLPMPPEAEVVEPEAPTHRLNEAIQTQAVHLVTRYSEARKAKHRAEYGDALKGELLDALVGDLEPPVEGLDQVLGMLELADLDDAPNEYVTRGRGYVRRLESVLERAHKISGLDAHHQDVVEEETIALREVVEELVEFEVGRRGEDVIKIVPTIGKLVPTRVKLDARRLRRGVADMLAAMSELIGSGRLDLHVTCDRIAAEEAGTLRFSLHHNGDGVDEDVVHSAFYPKGVEGTPEGLGLAGTRKAVQPTGGDLGLLRDEKGALTLWMNMPAIDMNPNQAGRREHGRLVQEAVRCSLGQVLDLSMGGLRVQCAKPPAGDVVDLDLEDDEESMAMRGRIMWRKRVSFGRHEIGLRFIEMDATTSARLSRLATRNRLRTMVEVDAA